MPDAWWSLNIAVVKQGSQPVDPAEPTTRSNSFQMCSVVFHLGKIAGHYDDVIMDTIASQITSLASAYSDV